MGVELDPKWQKATAFGVRPASPGYMECLRRLGVGEDELKGMSMRGAKAIMKAANSRKAAGLATLRQLQVLARAGVAETNVPFRNASIAIDYLKAVHYKPEMSRLLSLLAKGGMTCLARTQSI
jgi:hypothetical protein